MKTTITLFVEPNSLTRFIGVTRILEGLELENDYHFNPKDLRFSEEMISNWVWINMPIDEYLKLKYCTAKLTR